MRSLAVLLAALLSPAYGIAHAAPAADLPALEIRNVSALPVKRAGATDLQVRWTTPTPSKGRVSVVGSALSVDEDPSCLRGSTNVRDRGIGWANNHRALLAGAPGSGPWQVKITVTDAAGRTAEGGVGAMASVLPARAPASGSVKLRFVGRVPESPGEVATTGLPFPRGALFDASRVRLRLPSGQAVPAQAEVWSRWPQDGSIKWLLLDVMAAGPDVVLEYGGASQPATPRLLIDQGPDAIVVDTGRARLVVPRRVGFEGGLFLGEERKLGFPVSALVDADGKRLEGRILNARVENVCERTADGRSGTRLVPPLPRGSRYPMANGEALVGGPALRAVIRVDGVHAPEGAAGPRYPFTLRIHACAGATGFRVFHTFENDNTAQEMTSFRSLELRFPGAEAATVVGDREVPLPAGSRLFQQEDDRYILTSPTSGGGKRAAGWATTTSGAGIGVRHFWQQYPKSIEAAPGGLAIGLFPALPGPIYDDRPLDSKLFAHLRGGRYTLRQGFAKTHELYVDLAGDVKAAERLERPLVLAAPPEWYARGALRNLGPLEPGYAGYNALTAGNLETLLKTREEQHEYGSMHFGDWYGERTWNWGNLEYDLHHGLMMQFARTGDPRFYEQAVLAARHQMDIDTPHYHAEAARVGQQWIHSVMHTAGYFPPTFRDMKEYASRGWPDNRGHIWAEGMLDYALFSGDRRAWEVATRIADWAAGPQTTNFDFGNAREPGWMLILVMGAYNATGDPFYLNAARLMIERVREKSRPEEGFYAHDLPRGHCECTPPHRGEAGFMMGVLMTGMKMYYEASRDERVADDIVKMARFLVKTMWEPERMGFRYTSCPKTGVTTSSAAIELEGLAFAARRANDAGLADICRQALAAALPALSGAGKGMGYYLRSAPQMLAAVDALPGERFSEYQKRMGALVRSPARRPLPSLLGNPDYEAGTDGWMVRTGFSMTAAPEAAHSGRAGARVTGKGVAQNEYLVTVYDTGGTNPMEIVGPEPGAEYRLSLWMRVDRISPGAPAPSVRFSARDASGTRDSFVTNAYDLARLGTWQRLEKVFTIPGYNRRAYVAVNTNTRDEVDVDLSVDDWSLSPAATAVPDTPAWLIADASAAVPAPGAVKLQMAPPLSFAALSGGGGSFAVDVPVAGAYRLWVRACGPGVAVTSGGGPATVLKSAGGAWSWTPAPQPLLLPAGRAAFTVKPLGKTGQVSRLVLAAER